MNGFSNIQINVDECKIVAQKPVFKQGGTSLKNRKPKVPVPVQESNPWGNLEANGDSQLVDENTLMKDDSTNKVTAKFGKEGDRIMAGKPCANCTCGKKELLE